MLGEQKEGPSVNPVRDKLKAARNQLHVDAGNIEPAKKAMIDVAEWVSNSIESGRFSDDPEAYVLKAIAGGKDYSRRGKYLRYEVSPPEGKEKPPVTLVISQNENAHISYMGQHRFGLRPYALDNLIDKTPVEVFGELEDFYDAVERHGIRVADGFTSDIPPYKLGSYLDKFPYTKALGEKENKFRKGLQSYAEGKKQEKLDQTQPLKASLVASVRKLLWENSQGEVIPGALLSEAEQEALARLADVPSMYLDKTPKESLGDIERELTEEFFVVEKDEITGKEIIKINPVRLSGKFEREGDMISPNAELGGITRGHSFVRDEVTGALVMKPDIDTTFTDLTVTLAPSDEELTADLLDRNGNPTGRTITAKPILRAQLTETVAGKEDEKTSLYRTREGLVVICPGGTAKCYPDDLSAQAYITRKPVIYLYPTEQINVTVKLDYAGTLTNTYPQITKDTWQVTVTPDGTITTNGKRYKYLFWDGINGEMNWDWSEGFCVHKNNIDNFLEEKIAQFGLNFAESQDFITYWAPMMKQNEWSLVSFQTDRYEELAKLMIDPQPDALIRVFMVFKKVDKRVAIDEQKLKKVKRKGFTVVEWGGSNFDELQANQSIQRIIPLAHLSQPSFHLI